MSIPDIWLHVYGQYRWHSPATIRGTSEALKLLRDAIDAALAHDQNAKATVFAADGEGYSINVQMVNTMAALGSPEYIVDLESEFSRRESQRDAKHALASMEGGKT